MNLADLIRDGSIERLALTILVYAPMGFLWITQRPVDDRLIDIALVILGFYFGQLVPSPSTMRKIITSDKYKIPSPDR